MKSIIKLFFERMGIVILSNKNEIFKKLILTDPFEIQKSLFLSQEKLIIFDIGAQYGQTAFEYIQRFNTSTIYSFEPFNESFIVLNKNVKENANIKIFNLAFGDSIGIEKLNCNSFSATNSILETDDRGSSTWGNNLLETIDTTEISITTIDDFVEKKQISAIDILKIDVQGYEFNVIQGAKNLISNNGIRVIYLEVIILPTYKKQKYLDELLSLLRSFNFILHGMYNFNYDSFGSLRQFDAIFINSNYRNSIFI